MRIHYLQHVPFEGLGQIEPLLLEQGHELTGSHLYRGDELPALDDFDGLVVMGGPMGVDDGDRYPWLAPERELIAAAVAAGRKVLGICLGAQLIAAALGAPVSRNRWREIGWFPIHRDPQALSSPLGALFPEQLQVFHWHGDTFALPEGALRLASSEACVEQGFVLDERVVGLQFHIEMTPESAAILCKEGRDELDGSRFVQPAAEILRDTGRFACCHPVLSRLLQRLF